MKRLKIKKHLKINTVFVREPMKLLNDRICYMEAVLVMIRAAEF